ncbi:MAG: antitoxin component YwqK of YwqJK toxin-antitoxin module [Arenicella sp.]
MRRLIFILAFSAFSVLGQETIDKDTVFLDSKWKVTNYRELATYYRKTVMTGPDSILLVQDFFLENGNIQMAGTYHGEMKRSNRTGEFKYYYTNGNLKAIYDYKGGLIDGERKKFYSNGNIKSIEHFDLGIQIDTIFTYYENGQVQKICVLNQNYQRDNPAFKHAKMKMMSAYSDDGISQVTNGKGVFIEYFLSGKKRTEISYSDGLPHGKWIKYSGKKKKKSAIMTFKEGKFIKGEIHDNGKKDVFSSFSRKAYFPSGLRGLDKYLDDNLGGCNDIKDNELLLMVSIGSDGKAYFEQLISGDVGPCQLEELQMLVSNMPLWKAAIENGKYVDGNQAIRIKHKK